jgi:flagellar biosynthesis/type III secretory pathway M-ring protein FliF/YscJ
MEPDRGPPDDGTRSRGGRWLDPKLLGAAAAVLLLGLGAAVWLVLRSRSRRRALEEVARTLDAPAPDPGGAVRIVVPGTPREVPTLEPDTEPLPELSEEFARIGEQRKAIRERALKLASTEPDATAQLLRAWMVKKKAIPPVGAPNAR